MELGLLVYLGYFNLFHLEVVVVAEAKGQKHGLHPGISVEHLHLPLFAFDLFFEVFDDFIVVLRDIVPPLPLQFFEESHVPPHHDSSNISSIFEGPADCLHDFLALFGDLVIVKKVLG